MMGCERYREEGGGSGENTFAAVANDLPILKGKKGGNFSSITK